MRTLLGFGLGAALICAGGRSRRAVVAGFTFLGGLYYILFWLWPSPQDRQPNDIPNGFGERVGFWLADAAGPVSTVTQVLTVLLLGLGVYSVLRVHIARLVKRQPDWAFSIVLLVSMLAMVIIGYGEFRQANAPGADYEMESSWGFFQKGKDLLFDGLLQQMDAAMFSIIAFFILSAAYRAFRIRSVESTVLLATALVAMLAVMGVVEGVSASFVENLTHGNKDHFANNLFLPTIFGWIKANVQSPAILALTFGTGIGALAMGLRIWLSLERGGVGA